VSCTHCGTSLPTGALFCGECGRSVASSKLPPVASATIPREPKPRQPQHTEPRISAQVRWVEDPVTGAPLTDKVDEASNTDHSAEIDVEIRPGEVRCEQCGSIVGSDDIFCGECGFVSRSVARAFSSSDFTGETRQIHFTARVEPEAAPEPGPEASPKPVAETTPETQAEMEPEPEPEPEQDPEPETEPKTEPMPQAVRLFQTSAPAPELHQHDLVIPPAPVRRSAPPTAPAPSTPPPVQHRTRRSFLVDDGDEADAADLEATRIVSRVSGNRFVLQFSTGESFTVQGSGLIGRNPQPEPGEFFDHLVRVLDSGKSVSKTHLEFGQEGGVFWVKDRFSGNGTVIREPEMSARRAEADHRYRVIRGSRIDIGEQFFIIS
jgi:hypothetical protein